LIHESFSSLKPAIGQLGVDLPRSLESSEPASLDYRILMSFNYLLPSMPVPRSTPASPSTSLQRSKGQGWTPVRFACNPHPNLIHLEVIIFLDTFYNTTIMWPS
jgi:hypothetical protein